MSPEQIKTGLYRAADRGAENAFLKLAGRLAMIAAVPLLGWMLKTADDVRVNQIAMGQQIISLRQQIVEGTADRYTGTQAAKDWAYQAQRDGQQDADRTRIEDRVDTLEQWIRSKGG